MNHVLLASTWLKPHVTEEILASAEKSYVEQILKNSVMSSYERRVEHMIPSIEEH